MSPRELRDWEGYAAVEPFGHMRDNMHAGMIASAILNQHRKRGTRALTYEDFLLIPTREKFRNNTKRFFAGLKALAKRGGDRGGSG